MRSDNSDKVFDLQALNDLGAQIFSFNSVVYGHKIDMKALSDGEYFIVISTGDQVETHKFVKANY